jgi:hypothetical protein
LVSSAEQKDIEKYIKKSFWHLRNDELDKEVFQKNIIHYENSESNKYSDVLNIFPKLIKVSTFYFILILIPFMICGL